jgi:hypothetical protein
VSTKSLITGLLSGALAPLQDRVTEIISRLVKKAALLFAAAIAFLAALIALTIAFDLWIATLAGPIVAALAVAALYILAGTLAVVLALRDVPQPAGAAPAQPSGAPIARDEINQAAAPLLDLIKRSRGNPEQMALITAAFVAKKTGPVTLAGGALAAGFVIGRFWKSWRQILESGVTALPVLAALLEQFAADSSKNPEP